MSFLKIVLLNERTLKAKTKESRHIKANTIVRVLCKSPVNFQKKKNDRNAAKPLIKKMAVIQSFNGLFNIGSLGFLGFSSITPFVSCSVVRAISGNPSSTRFIQRIWAGNNGSGNPIAMLTKNKK